MLRCRRTVFQLSILLFLGVTPDVSTAVDGVIEINAARAAAGSINGDATADPPGLPVTITQPGSYRLTGSLSGATANQHTIEIESPGVSLDMNGFSIVGPRTATNSPTGSGVGIRAVDAGNLRIANGTIQGTGDYGILVADSPNVQIESVMVSFAGDYGIFVNDCPGALVQKVSVHQSKSGIHMSSHRTRENSGILEDCSVIDNESLNTTTVTVRQVDVRGCRIDRNATTGLTVLDGGMVKDTTVDGNAGDGIVYSQFVGFVGFLSVIDSTVARNTGLGIKFTVQSNADRALIDNTMLLDNTGGQVDFIPPTTGLVVTN